MFEQNIVTCEENGIFRANIILDYIFATHNYIKPLCVLEPTDPNEIRERYVGFPADHYPSDHLPLAAYFEIPKRPNHKESELSSTIQVDKPEKTPCKIAVTLSTSSTQPSSSKPHVISTRTSSPGKIFIKVAKKE